MEEDFVDFENNKRSNKIVTIVCICVLVVCLYLLGKFVSLAKSCVNTYNQLVELQTNVETAEAGVENMMQRRLELIPDLVETVKAYSNHEEKVFEDIASAREELNTALSGDDLNSISDANENLSIAINNLLALAENYPDLTAGEQYTNLMDQLEGSVNRIAIKRENYNEYVSLYNKTVRKFPGNLVAKLFGFEEIETFKADEAANSVNMVDFNSD